MVPPTKHTAFDNVNHAQFWLHGVLSAFGSVDSGDQFKVKNHGFSSCFLMNFPALNNWPRF